MPDFPGYAYDPATGYVSASSGRDIPQRNIDALMDAHIAEAERRMAELTDAAHDGDITVAVWAALMQMELERLYLQAAALGAGGFDAITEADLEAANNDLRRDLSYLAAFAAVLAAGELSKAQAANRVRGYMGGARVIYHTVRRAAQRAQAGRRNEVPLEIRDLDPAAIHCRDCPGYAERGFQPAGVLPVPGRQCQCRNNCRCSMRTVWVPAGEVGEWVGTRRRA